MCCFILRVSPVLVKVYDFFPSSMRGHVRQPCLELQRKLPGGREGGGFRLFNLARTKRSRIFTGYWFCYILVIYEQFINYYDCIVIIEIFRAVVISPHSSFGLIKSSTATRNIAIKIAQK